MARYCRFCDLDLITADKINFVSQCPLRKRAPHMCCLRQHLSVTPDSEVVGYKISLFSKEVKNAVHNDQ